MFSPKSFRSKHKKIYTSKRIKYLALKLITFLKDVFYVSQKYIFRQFTQNMIKFRREIVDQAITFRIAANTAPSWTSEYKLIQKSPVIISAI